MDELLIKYPCPRPENQRFVKYWEKFVPDISDRENLKPTHLEHLTILCDLQVEYEEIRETLELEGRTYESVGRNGTQRKLSPLVGLQGKIISEIRNYSKLLGLVLVKDSKMTNDKDGENEFD